MIDNKVIKEETEEVRKKYNIELNLTSEECKGLIKWLKLTTNKRNAVSGDIKQWVELNPVLEQIRELLTVEYIVQVKW